MSKLTGSVLTPCPGRDCNSAKGIKEKFEKGFDFMLNHPLHPFTRISIRDFEDGDTVEIRYGKLRKLIIYHITKEA